MPQTILIVEDDELIVDSVRYGLEREGYRVLAAYHGEQGLAVARAEAPDLVLLDVMMPVMDGLQMCRTLRSESTVPIIMLTARGEELDKVLGLELGADDYLVKPFSMRELVARIRAQLRRAEMAPRGAVREVAVGSLVLDPESRLVTRNGRPVDLRPREYDLLAVLMSNAGRAYERSELLDAVWGAGWFGDVRTLDVHVRWLRQKLEEDPADPHYILTVRGHGYRFAAADEVEPMLRALWSSFKGRLVVTYLAIFLVSTAIVAGRAGYLFDRTIRASVEQDLRVQAFAMATFLGQPWTLWASGDLGLTLPQLESLTGRFEQNAGTHVTILDRGGRPVATSFTSIPPNQSAQPEVQAAREGRIENFSRFEPLTGENMIFTAAPVTREREVLGIVQLAVPMSVVSGQSREYWAGLALTAVLAALATAVAGWWLAGQLVRPIDRLRRAAAQLAAGDLDERVPAQGVSEVAILAAAFNNMAERIQATMNRDRAFVANASHELRTPLTNIKLRAEALNNGALEDQAVARRFAGEIESEANRLGRMAGDLLALSRQDAGAQTPREPVDLSALAADVVEQMRLRAERNGVTLLADHEEGLPPLEANGSGLQAALINLVDNALQYTPRGGCITVRVGRAPGGSEALELSVGDTGVGIAPEDLPRIFDRFYRADKAHSRRMAQQGNGSAIAGSGAGLGLAIVRGIVEEHGGTIRVESEAGQGAVFTATFPLVPAGM